MKRSSGSPLITEMNEIQALKLRVTKLEIALYQIITALNDQGDAIKAAKHLPITCGDCGQDMNGKETCSNQPCQWGFPIDNERE